MSAKLSTDSESKKSLFAFLAVGLTAVGLGLIFLLRSRFAGSDSLNPGFWICFAAFLTSFMSVRNHGKNGLAMLAFWVSFVGMCAAVFISAM